MSKDRNNNSLHVNIINEIFQCLPVRLELMSSTNDMEKDKVPFLLVTKKLAKEPQLIVAFSITCCILRPTNVSRGTNNNKRGSTVQIKDLRDLISSLVCLLGRNELSAFQHYPKGPSKTGSRG